MEVGGVYIELNKALLRFIRSKVRLQEDAEDILQNVFVKISSNIETIQNKEKLHSWIYAIARNAIIDYYRRKKIISESIDDLTDANVADEENTDLKVSLETCLTQFINNLPEEYRQIIIDAELHGIKQKDLAIKYNMAYPSLRSRVQRGRERLKKILLDCCHVEVDLRGNILDARYKDDRPAQDSFCGSCNN